MREAETSNVAGRGDVQEQACRQNSVTLDVSSFSGPARLFDTAAEGTARKSSGCRMS